jgi:hypothetical protein
MTDKSPMITIDRVTRTVNQWAAHLGINPRLLRSRLKKGWSPKEAVATPAVVGRKTTTRTITARGETLGIRDWARRLGTSRQLIYQRLRDGWNEQDAVTFRDAPRRITANGETLSVHEWAVRLGVSYQTIYHRLKDGWTEEEAVTTGGRIGRRITVRGVTRTVAEWARSTGVSPDVIRARLKYGWTEERAATTPLGVSRVRKTPKM